jgi:hypothetical protein
MQTDAKVIAAAEDYARRGFSVIPVKTDKTPAVRAWKNSQLKPASESEVADWFARTRRVGGVGIVLGEVSGHLYARDFDDPHAYEAWASVHPELSQSLPTVRTSRGYHVYGRWKGVATQKFDDGELRGGGAYVVAPPSQNAVGGVYEWLVPLPSGAVSEVDPHAAGLAPPQSVVAGSCYRENGETELNRENREKGETEDTEDTEDSQAISNVWNSETRSRVEDAIRRTLPMDYGKRNNALFRFARALKAIPELRRTPPDRVRLLKPFVQEWFRRARPRILTADFAVTWGDFVNCWKSVRIAEGDDVIGEALDAARATSPPEWSKEYSKPCQLLASLCRELQRRAGLKPFFLGCVTAGMCVDVQKMTANRYLHAFEADGHLRTVERGSKKTGRASRFRYLAPDLRPNGEEPPDPTEPGKERQE